MHRSTKMAILATSVFLIGIAVFPMINATAIEVYDPLPDVPGKFMGPHGHNHQEWHYHGPPAHEHEHCDAALEDPTAPEGVHHSCESGHH